MWHLLRKTNSGGNKYNLPSSRSAAPQLPHHCLHLLGCFARNQWMLNKTKTKATEMLGYFFLHGLILEALFTLESRGYTCLFSLLTRSDLWLRKFVNYSHDEVGIYSITSWATVFIFLNISVGILTSLAFLNKPDALVFFKIFSKTPDSQSSMRMWELSWHGTQRPENSPAGLNRSLSGRTVSPSLKIMLL